MNSRAALLLAALLAAPQAARAGEPLAVLTSASGAYMEAFSAFQAAYGGEVQFVEASARRPAVPAGTSVIVAFGGKAASRQYPPGIPVVYCMAPGLSLKAEQPETRSVKISLIPQFSEIFTRLKLLQPGLRRLRVFWMTQSFAPFETLARETGTQHGIEVTSVRVFSAEDLPALLRQTLTSADAFWLPPDPLLLTPEILMILREFSWGNGIPFYGSTKGMTREGATASAGVSFRAMGEAAAGAAVALTAGEKVPALVFPEGTELTISASSAKKCGLQLPQDLLRRADYLFP